MATKLSSLNVPVMNSFTTHEYVSSLTSFFMVGARTMITGKATKDEKNNVAFTLEIPDEENPSVIVKRDLTLSVTEPRLFFVDHFKKKPNDKIGPLKLEKKIYDKKKDEDAKGNSVWVFLDAE